MYAYERYDRMDNKSILLSVSELKPGMVIAREISSDNTLLISKGSVVNEKIIAKLKQKLVFEKIEIYSNDEGKPAQVPVVNRKSVEDIRESFEQLSLNAEDILANLGNDNFEGMKDIRSFSKKIQEELNSTSAIVKNVVLYGSGQDSIYRHSVNVAALSCILGGWIGLEESKINLLTYSAILHDYGKTKLNRVLLYKVEALTKAELKEIRNHPVLGYEDIKRIQYLDSSVSYGVLMHHERLDGSGYPFGIKDEKIHSFAKIIAIADVFDAINSNRSYKKSKGPFEVLEIIQNESLGKLDYEYCKVFLDHIINYYIGEKVLLNTGEVCKIVQINTNDLSRPLLLKDSGFVDLKKETNLFVMELVI
jgi:HD-GYP domain-containing protein (c-di-GMP phosphodiesterase class II)